MAIDNDFGRLHIPAIVKRLGGFLLACVGLLVALICLTASVHAWWAVAIFGSLVLLGLWDMNQRHHALMRNYPIIARARWVFEELRPYLRQYVVEGDLEGRPIDRDSRSVCLSLIHI